MRQRLRSSASIPYYVPPKESEPIRLPTGGYQPIVEPRDADKFPPQSISAIIPVERLWHLSARAVAEYNVAKATPQALRYELLVPDDGMEPEDRDSGAPTESYLPPPQIDERLIVKEYWA